MAASPVFDYLTELERRARKNAAPLPRQEELRDTWTGMGFRIQDSDALVPLDEVEEVLTIPVITVVPGTQNWVKGIANVRGSLLPIMDLRGFLGLPERAPTPMSRVIVVHHEGIFAGLIVDQVWGLKHFFLDQIDDGDSPDPAMNEPMQPYVTRSFKDEKQVWPVFSMHALAEDGRFLQVAE